MTIPKYTPKHYKKMISTVDPIGVYDGFTIKCGDNFELGPVRGSKVRQCLHVVHEHLSDIRKHYNNGLVTGAGLPSPQTTIVAAVARYFGMKCAITTPKYDNKKKDFFRINASLSQKLGATVYGVGNPNTPGYELDSRCLASQLGYFRIKFGMLGHVVMEPVIWQCQNIPDYIKDIVIISGSGISALSVMSGCAIWRKNVERMHVVTLSGYYEKNKASLYDHLPENEKFQGKVFTHPSPIPYRSEFKWGGDFDFDLTYESKAFKWMTENMPRNYSTLFWVIGKRNYNLKLVEPIKWHMSEHEKELRFPIPTLQGFLA